MKKTTLRFGIFSGLTLFALGWINFFIGKQFPDYGLQEILGYATILLSMVFVFVGIKQYRDKENGGIISYWKAIKVGLLIILLPSLAFGIFDLIYVKYLDPDFMEKYYSQMVEHMQHTLKPDEFKIKLAEMESEKAMFASPVVQFVVMFFTVFAIGLVVTAISALILQRKPKIQTT